MCICTSWWYLYTEATALLTLCGVYLRRERVDLDLEPLDLVVFGSDHVLVLVQQLLILSVPLHFLV